MLKLVLDIVAIVMYNFCLCVMIYVLKVYQLCISTVICHNRQTACYMRS